MNQGPNENAVYIYKAMRSQAGYSILWAKFNSLSDDEIAQLKANNQAIWLLRESNSMPGYLTIDYLYFDNKTQQWEKGSDRMCLTKNGWVTTASDINETTKVNEDEINQVTAETYALHAESLTDHILSKDNLKYILLNRMNPRKNEQSKLPIFSKYVSISNTNGANDVAITEGVKQALTCEITNRLFTNPVVLTRNVTIISKDGVYNLYKGRSYEKSAIDKLKIKGNNLYYPNNTLERVINRIGSNDLIKLESLIDDWLTDAASLMPMETPVIIPTGNSYSKESIDAMIQSGRTLRDPIINKDEFKKEDVINNINLDNFIKEWGLCKELLIQEEKRKQEDEICKLADNNNNNVSNRHNQYK